MDVRQAIIDGFLALMLDHFDAIPFMVKGRLEEGEVDGRHRWCEDDVFFFIFLRKERLRIAVWFRCIVYGLTVVHDEEERT